MKIKNKDDYFTSIIYKLTFPNGKFYIGQTITPFGIRMRSHKYASNNPKYPISYAIVKYRWENVKKEIIFYCPLKDTDIWEKVFISLYQSLIDENGYNLNSGGESRKRLHPSTIEKIRKGNLGRTPPNKGKHYSKEIIEKIKMNMRDVSGKNNPMYGRSLSGELNGMYGRTGKLNPNSKITYQYDLDFNLIKIWNGVKDIQREIGIDSRMISGHIKNSRGRCKGFIFRYFPLTDEDKIIIKRKQQHNLKQVA